MVDLSHYRGECDCCDAVMELRARLSAVLALCDQTGGGPDAWLYVIDVLAAACGEGDRPPPECPHPDWSFDRTICGGCDSMPDVCTECGWHECGEDDRRNLES